MGVSMSRSERMGALLELARLRASELVNIVDGTDEALALLDWLREEAEEAAADDQSGLAEDEFAPGVRIGWDAGEAD